MCHELAYVRIDTSIYLTILSLLCIYTTIVANVTLTNDDDWLFRLPHLFDWCLTLIEETLQKKSRKIQKPSALNTYIYDFSICPIYLIKNS